MKASLAIVTACAILAVSSAPASATFHIMQIEQVIGGVDGNTSVQAIQLRERTGSQNNLQFARLFAWDAAGANPVLLIDFTTPVSNIVAGSRILVASSNFSSFTNPALTPDYVLTNTIPASYLAAGSLTFEDKVGTVYWRLSWGGAAYTGSTLGTITNDADGNFGPPFGGALPSASGKALAFQFAFSAPSVTNAGDYALTSGSATFVRNNGGSGTIVSTVGVGEPPLAFSLGAPFPNPVRGVMTYALTLPHPSWVRVDVLDLTGRRVGRLVDGEVAAGRSTFSWDPRGESLRGGVYTLDMEADGVRVLRRFVFVRDAHAPAPYVGPHPD
jgi:flagellar hook capping protein FlgD